MQAFPTSWFLIGFVLLVCAGLFRLCKSVNEETSSSRRSRTRYRRASPPRPRVTRETIPRSSIRFGSDESSSPIGGSCLNCGAVIKEETSLHCSYCGVEHQRCPICHRFVTANQALLQCPHCKTLGHANEMQEWVQKSSKCPYCGQTLRLSQLKKFSQR